MTKIHYKKSLFKGNSGLTESIFCAPFEDPSLFQEDAFENDRFKKIVEEGNKYLEYTSLEDCDYVVIPYKWDNRSEQTLNIIQEANQNNKKVITLHNDDYPPSFRLSPDEGFLFTTTLEKSQKNNNEFGFPAFTGDFFEEYGGSYISNKNLGFCGAITHPIRSYVLAILEKSKVLNSNFIVRNSFWAHREMTKDEARKGFFQNMTENTFILCMRGAGNFSYRIYEAMMMGRIPVIINSDQVFPFENILNYNEFSIIIDFKKLYDIENIISSWLENKTDEDILNIQKKNRELWLEYMSPLGFVKNFKKELTYLPYKKSIWV